MESSPTYRSNAAGASASMYPKGVSTLSIPPDRAVWNLITPESEYTATKSLRTASISILVASAMRSVTPPGNRISARPPTSE